MFLACHKGLQPEVVLYTLQILCIIYALGKPYIPLIWVHLVFFNAHGFQPLRTDWIHIRLHNNV